MINEISLKKHNLGTYELITREYEKRNHVAVVQATGTGKSYLVAKYIEDMYFKKVLFLSPSVHIANQFKNKFCLLEPCIQFMTYRKLSLIDDIEMFLKTYRGITRIN